MHTVHVIPFLYKMNVWEAEMLVICIFLFHVQRWTGHFWSTFHPSGFYQDRPISIWHAFCTVNMMWVYCSRGEKSVSDACLRSKAFIYLFIYLFIYITVGCLYWLWSCGVGAKYLGASCHWSIVYDAVQSHGQCHCDLQPYSLAMESTMKPKIHLH